MPAPKTSEFRLETHWTPAEGAETSIYEIRLFNGSATVIKNFRLCITGPNRIDPDASVENANVALRLSNHTQFEMPAGVTLAAGALWNITIRALKVSMSHWTEGTTSAYLVLSDGRTASVDVASTRNRRDETPLKTGAVVFPVADPDHAQLSIVPWPNEVHISSFGAAPGGLHIVATTDRQRQATEAFSGLALRLFQKEMLVSLSTTGALRVSLQPQSDVPAEGYAIKLATEEAVVLASDQTGFLYGLITLAQMLRGARLHPNIFRFPTGGEIVDRPRLRWRGIMLDTARQFYSMAELEGFLDTMAWNKLNRFHWHFSDDEAWRLEIDAYPELTKIGGWRGLNLPIPPLLGSGPAAYGGIYSKNDARHIISRAGQLGIEVVPEFDVPGHCYCVLLALPWLRDPDEAGVYRSIQAFPNNCLNPAREETYQFLETIFGEIADLFPSRYIHVGADEVPSDAWEGSPQAQAMLNKLGGGGAARLQSELLRRLQTMLSARGKITGAWEEAAQGGGIDKHTCYLNGWHSIGISAKLAGEGYDVVICPGQTYYFDMAHGPEFSEPGASWAGWSSLEKLYSFDFLEGWSKAQEQHCLGLQANIWSEPMTHRSVFERLVYPRMSALAESAWTAAGQKSFARFKGQTGLMPVLKIQELP